ncbi:hypothetical protein [Mycolicibacterium sphagni]|uniref:hypothetical protein n=1 Tax=Mycolicibacterium sphagni TaxID=1786 RepID=UPI0021F2D5BE|nr:hypothetical protein [Mycolicibacterium sphagni]MCV7175446.1 hypothetical protein [Mycolicibacterium sphagni]
MTAPNLTWRTAYGLKSHRQLPGALLDIAAELARRAIEDPRPGDDSGLAKLDRAIAVGGAAELLIKSTLAGISLSLLAGSANTPTVVALSGTTTRPTQEKVITLGGPEALRRLNSCRRPSSSEIAEPKFLFEIRNDALHMGLTPEGAALETALTELVSLVQAVFEIRRALGQEADWNRFWSTKHLQIVEARQQAGYERLNKRFKEMLAAAHSAYLRLTAGLGNFERSRLVAELNTRAPEVDGSEHLRSHTCPACENTLWVVYNVVRDIEIDDSDAPHSFAHFVKERGYVSSATCPVCGLELNQSDMVFTDIPFVIEIGEDEASDDEVQAWQDAKDAVEEEQDRFDFYSDPDNFPDWDDRD